MVTRSIYKRFNHFNSLKQWLSAWKWLFGFQSFHLLFIRCAHRANRMIFKIKTIIRENSCVTAGRNNSLSWPFILPICFCVFFSTRHFEKSAQKVTRKMTIFYPSKQFHAHNFFVWFSANSPFKCLHLFIVFFHIHTFCTSFDEGSTDDRSLLEGDELFWRAGDLHNTVIFSIFILFQCLNYHSFECHEFGWFESMCIIFMLIYIFIFFRTTAFCVV